MMEETITVTYRLVKRLAYGENPQQKEAGLYVREGDDDPLAIHRFRQRAGSDPSYNNLCDLQRLKETMTHAIAGLECNDLRGIPFTVALGAKHGNCCGGSYSNVSTRGAIAGMLYGDPRAIFGGSVMVNTGITCELAELLVTDDEDKRRILDMIVAPTFDDDAVEILARKKGKCRLFENPVLGQMTMENLDKSPRFRYVCGGILIQDNYTFVPHLRDRSLFTHYDDISNATLLDLVFAWAIGCSSVSNTITLVKDSMLIGNGVGQQDRVGAVELALKRAHDAGHDPIGAHAYSDSFFPFTDGPQRLITEGIKAIFATSGSIKDADVIKVCRDAGISIVTNRDIDGRGFFGH